MWCIERVFDELRSDGAERGHIVEGEHAGDERGRSGVERVFARSGGKRGVDVVRVEL